MVLRDLRDIVKRDHVRLCRRTLLPLGRISQHPPGAGSGGTGVLSLVGACLTAALPDMVEQLVFINGTLPLPSEGVPVEWFSVGGLHRLPAGSGRVVWSDLRSGWMDARDLDNESDQVP